VPVEKPLRGTVKRAVQYIDDELLADQSNAIVRKDDVTDGADTRVLWTGRTSWGMGRPAYQAQPRTEGITVGWLLPQPTMSPVFAGV
jgi:hypothetical protein